MNTLSQNSLIGISVVSLASNFCSLDSFAKEPQPTLSEKNNEESFYLSKNSKSEKAIVHKFKKILKLVPKLTINYGISAIFALLTVAITDKVSEAFFGVKYTNILKSFL